MQQQHQVAAAAAVVVVLLSLELGIVTWCTVWPLHGQLHRLAKFSGWLDLYHLGTSTLDVLLLAVLRTGVLLLLYFNTTPGGSARQYRRGGLSRAALRPPTPLNHEQTAAVAAVVSSSSELLLLAKAIAVAVLAPDMVLPSPAAPGVSGLLCSYVSIATSLVSSLVTGVLVRWLIAQRGLQAAAKEADEEAPLLSSSWERRENNKQLHQGERGAPGGPAAASAAALSSAAAAASGGAGGEAPSRIQPATVRELLRLSVPDTPLLLVAFLFGSAAALMSACVPYYTGQIIDYASIDPDRRRFGATTLKLLGVAVLCGLFTGLRGGLFSVGMVRLNVRLRRALFASLLRQEVGFFDTAQTGEISSRLSADTTTVSDSVSLNLNILVRSATQAVTVLVFMLTASWRLTVVTFVLVPGVLVISKVYGGYYRKLSKRVQSALAEANAVAEEVLSAVPTVRANGATRSSDAAYGAKLAVFYRLQCRQALAYSLYAATITFLPSVVVAVVLFYGGSLVLNSEMSPGALVSFMLYQQSLSSAFSMMGDVFSGITAALGAADKVIELIKRRPREPPAGDFVPDCGTLAGSLALQGVVFAYPGRPSQLVLNGFSLAVSPGEVVALVGPSGGGKSTIIKLLQRFYLPASGAVLVDGRDVGLYDPAWLRRHVALVSQEPVLFARSVRDNIVYGLGEDDGWDAPPTQEQVEAAARQANAHEFITAFPDGYDTPCGEKGVVLSGGQKQRIAVARALVRQPQVLLLDEATSALDTESEAVVQEALGRLMAGRTVLVIAHRLSTIVDAHRICVVAAGQLAEQGSHEELIAARGLYAGLIARQLAATGGGGGGGVGGGGGSGSSGSGGSEAGGAAMRSSLSLGSLGSSSGGGEQQLPQEPQGAQQQQPQHADCQEAAVQGSEGGGGAAWRAPAASSSQWPQQQQQQQQQHQEPARPGAG